MFVTILSEGLIEYLTDKAKQSLFLEIFKNVLHNGLRAKKNVTFLNRLTLAIRKHDMLDITPLLRKVYF